ncbi:secreted RxLR effector protein 161-like [Nicotiana sylvestris]|uniref:secreted RxLR effector protein 161-like n=1 Tax=Nicotiana sylvestris TaxID=4096 RepID=UPI00388C47B0
MRYFLGLEVARSKQGILVCQRKFTFVLIATLGLAGSKPACTPIDTSHKLTSVEYDHANAHATVDVDELLSDPSSYQKLVGKLLYLTMTRLDISYAVQNLSQFMHKPKKSHWEGSIRVVRYLKNAPGLGILLSSQYSNQLTVYCDADWATCPMTRRSVSGFVVKLGDSLISWKSKKQNTVSRSSTEAEYRSMANAIAEVVWFTGLFKELNVELKLPIKLYCDNLQIADVLTKGLGKAQHEFLLSKLECTICSHCTA